MYVRLYIWVRFYLCVGVYVCLFEDDYLSTAQTNIVYFLFSLHSNSTYEALKTYPIDPS